MRALAPLLCFALAQLAAIPGRAQEPSAPGRATAGAALAPAPLEATPWFSALSVADVDASARWYARLFGLEVAREIDLPEHSIRIRLLVSERFYLELVEDRAAKPLRALAPEGRRPNVVHGPFKFGFLVADLDGALERLRALGVAPRGPAFAEPDGSMRSVQVEDPDGNVLQLFERLAPRS